jgi:hypothetical protein
MKSLFLTLTLALVCSLCQSASATPLPPSGIADIQIVVSAKKIRLISDESPVKKLDVEVKNQAGETVLQKRFNSKITDWSLDIQSLPAGEYRIFVDAVPVKKFERSGEGV